MTDAVRHQGARLWLRALIFIIGALETAVLVFLVSEFMKTSDPLGVSITQAITLAVAVPYVLLALPGMIMAYANCWLPLALLLVAAVPAAYFLFLWQNA